MLVYAPILGSWRYLRKKLMSRFSMVASLVSAGLVLLLLSSHYKSQQSHQAKVNMTYTFYNMTEINLEHLSRIKHVQQVCQDHDGDLFGLSPPKWAYGRIEVDRQQNYLYCPLLKAGSTFFRRIFFSLRQNRQTVNPYNVPIQKALSAKRSFLQDILPTTLPSTVAFLNNSTSIMFVREPFSRLLSGYADKLFAPNPYFWAQIGSHVVTKYRPSATPKALKCGHDVTFAEFIRYVLDSEASNSSLRDAHFTPSYDQCKPCNINYTILGKMETFQKDVAYTLALLGQNVSREELSVWAQNATLDAIMDSTMSPYSWRTAIKKCMTWYEALRRVWRKLQIRGIILFEHQFPWLPEFTEKVVTVRIFSNMVKKLHQNTEKELLRRQKIEILAEAYSTVPSSDLRELVQVFQLDFQLFQYDPRPNYIFDDVFVESYRDKRRVFNVYS